MRRKRLVITRKNIWPFGSSKKKTSEEAPSRRRKAGSGMTFARAATLARAAGRKSGDEGEFRNWLESHHLDDRSELFQSKVKDAYFAGVDDKDNEAREKETRKAEAEQERERRRKERQDERESREARKFTTKQRTATAKAKQYEQSGKIPFVPHEDDIRRAYESGATTLNEALEMAGGFRIGKSGEYGQSNPSRYRRRKHRNPAQEAIEGYRDFHGRDPEEFVTVERTVHFHRNLSGAGELKRLGVIPVDTGRRKRVRSVTLTKFKGAILAFNEKRNQLFIEGGDQEIDLNAFGIDPAKAHELETLGRVKKIDYFTRKDHLGSDGGTAVYQHTFRMTNENGRHVTVRIARYPDLIYRVIDKHLEFSGGSYEILPEGIDR